MVGRTSFENIKTLMTLPTSTRDADDYVSHPRISELKARSYVGGVEYTFKVSHNVELNTTMMNEYNDGDGFKRRVVYEFWSANNGCFPAPLFALTKPTVVSVDSTPSPSRESYIYKM